MTTRRARRSAPGSTQRPPEPRELYRSGDHRILAWAERHPVSIRGPGRRTQLYVRVEASATAIDARGRAVHVQWQHVATWPARVDRAPWWRPWERREELMAVVERAIALIEAEEHEQRTVEVTLDAVAEAMDAAAPIAEKQRAR